MGWRDRPAAIAAPNIPRQQRAGPRKQLWPLATLVLFQKRFEVLFSTDWNLAVGVSFDEEVRGHSLFLRFRLEPVD